jgi:HTH-type transcriptional regulator, competence development regulator
MPFGESLKRILETKHKTQKELADMIGVDYGYMSRLVSDKAPFRPSREFILKITQKLKCSESEKNELLKQAGRLDKEIEQIAKEAIDRPKLQSLFKSAPKLSEDQLDTINKKIEEILSKKNKK